MSGQDDPPVAREGHNPQPNGGWTTDLTGYEFEYIRIFGYRPVRSEWRATEAEYAALNANFEAAIQEIGHKPAVSGSRQEASTPKTFSLGLLMISVLIMSAVGVGLGVVGLAQVSKASTVQEATRQIEEEIVEIEKEG